MNAVACRRPIANPAAERAHSRIAGRLQAAGNAEQVQIAAAWCRGYVEALGEHAVTSIAEMNDLDALIAHAANARLLAIKGGPRT